MNHILLLLNGLLVLVPIALNLGNFYLIIIWYHFGVVVICCFSNKLYLSVQQYLTSFDTISWFINFIHPFHGIYLISLFISIIIFIAIIHLNHCSYYFAALYHNYCSFHFISCYFHYDNFYTQPHYGSFDNFYRHWSYFDILKHIVSYNILLIRSPYFLLVIILIYIVVVVVIGII